MSQRMTVGDGPTGSEVRTVRTWYAFWGFLPINGKNTGDYAGPSRDYEIHTSFRVSDVILNFFTFPFTFMRRTTVLEL